MGTAALGSNWFRGSFKLKLVGILSIINLVIFCAGGFLSYRIHLHLYNQEISKQFAKMNEQALSEINSRILGLYQLSTMISFNPDVEGAVNVPQAVATRYARYVTEESLNDEIGPQRSNLPDLMGIALYTGASFNDSGCEFKQRQSAGCEWRRYSRRHERADLDRQRRRRADLAVRR